LNILKPKQTKIYQTYNKNPKKINKMNTKKI
jgi:hypothetical protein